MKRAALSLVLVVALLWGADYAARLYAQQRVASQLVGTLGASSRPSVHISGFPFLWNLLADGTVRSVDVRLGSTGIGPLHVAAVNATVDRIRVQRSSLLGRGAIKIDSTGPATLDAVVTAQQVSAVFGQRVQLLANGSATTSLFGQRVTLHPSISRSEGISLGIPGLPRAHLPLPATFRLGGCSPELRISAGEAVLGCHFQTVPRSLLQRV
ncbi:MAG: DUF2993 domain-containing protein [Actinomycetota bacterium]|nr:DUF2993 domain-containing protein [Actinomycetota bacterium]